MKNFKKYKGIIFVLISYLIWGTSAYMVTLFPDVSSVSLVWGRGVFGSVLLGMYFLIFRKKSLKIKKARKHFSSLFIQTLSVVGMLVFMTAGIKYSSVSNTMLLVYTAPAFVGVISSFVLYEKPKGKDFLSMMLAGFGLVFMFGQSLGNQFRLADLFGLISGFFWAFQIVWGKKLGENFSGVDISFYTQVISVLLLMFLVDYKALINTNLLLLAAYGILHSLIAPVLFYEGIRFIKAQSSGILSLIDPAESVLLAYLFLGEMPTLGTVIGGIMILLSIVVQSFSFKD